MAGTSGRQHGGVACSSEHGPGVGGQWRVCSKRVGRVRAAGHAGADRASKRAVMPVKIGRASVLRCERRQAASTTQTCGWHIVE